jgi:hypothetical protein
MVSRGAWEGCHGGGDGGGCVSQGGRASDRKSGYQGEEVGWGGGKGGGGRARRRPD